MTYSNVQLHHGAQESLIAIITAIPFAGNQTTPISFSVFPVIHFEEKTWKKTPKLYKQKKHIGKTKPLRPTHHPGAKILFLKARSSIFPHVDSLPGWLRPNYLPKCHCPGPKSTGGWVSGAFLAVFGGKCYIGNLMLVLFDSPFGEVCSVSLVLVLERTECFGG